VRYAHSAAKFWPSVIDEVSGEYPRWSAVELAAPVSGPLRPEQLTPEVEFEKDLIRLLSGDLDRTMQDVIAELEVLGPPSQVNIRVLSGAQELLARQLPADCLDADIFPYLVVWLLKWARIPERDWNRDRVAGRLEGVDRVRRRVYGIDFVVSGRHVAEGLFDRTVKFAARVSPWR